MRTSMPGVSVAGKLTGVAGAEQAEVEGRLAAYGTLQALGLLDADRASALARPVRRTLARRRRFAAAVLSRFAPDAATHRLSTAAAKRRRLAKIGRAHV